MCICTKLAQACPAMYCICLKLVGLSSVAVLIEIKVFIVHLIGGDGTHKATNKQMRKR